MVCSGTKSNDFEGKIEVQLSENVVDNPILDVRDLDIFEERQRLKDVTNSGMNVTNIWNENDIKVVVMGENDLNQRKAKISDDFMMDISNCIDDDNATLVVKGKKHCITKQKPIINVAKVPVLECSIR